jgi:hypothetical protein
MWSRHLDNQMPFRLLHPEVSCMANRKLGYLDLQSRQLLRWPIKMCIVYMRHLFLLYFRWTGCKTLCPSHIYYSYFFWTWLCMWSWVSSVGIATGYELDGWRVGVGDLVGALSMSSRLVLEPTQPPLQWILGALSQGVKWPGHEADHLTPTSAVVKNMWICTFTLPYIFLA